MLAKIYIFSGIYLFKSCLDHVNDKIMPEPMRNQDEFGGQSFGFHRHLCKLRKQ